MYLLIYTYIYVMYYDTNQAISLTRRDNTWCEPSLWNSFVSRIRLPHSSKYRVREYSRVYWNLREFLDDSGDFETVLYSTGDFRE